MQRTLASRRGPLARAARPLLEQVALSAEAPETASHGAARLLGRLFDLRGSVELAKALSGAKPLLDDDIDVEAGKRLRALVTDEVNDLRRRVLRVMERWVTKLPDDATALARLVSEPTKNPSAREIAALADEVWSPLAEEATKLLFQARTQFRALRKELGPDIAAMSQRAARLERLDGLLTTATSEAVETRIGRLIPAAKGLFVRELGAVVEGMPREADSVEARRWLEARAPIRGAVRQLEELVLGALDFETDRLDALVEATTRA